MLLAAAAIGWLDIRQRGVFNRVSKKGLWRIMANTVDTPKPSRNKLALILMQAIGMTSNPIRDWLVEPAGQFPKLFQRGGGRLPGPPQIPRRPDTTHPFSGPLRRAGAALFAASLAFLLPGCRSTSGTMEDSRVEMTNFGTT